ncbi:YELLOW STRIPE like 1 isoform 3 [Theobroma cacao]|uniref:YELLOW STRIPE like 1 isoform 3 n=1 Tax=Theobroma cacao TaxID=3641 RepID=A0A061G3Y3_THECC|nr:YELLOW STRIPE like 1 isoform 3 [Theobroma cacao]EOY23907.1 YELLOW STRIPE like 1 isoform 3 [Theobroma cacao]
MSMEEVKEKKENQRDNLEERQQETEGSRIIQPWTKQITVRGFIVSILIGTIYSVIAMKLNLTTGMVPNLNVSAALLAFVFIRTWTKVVQKAGFMSKPFTRQENTMIQTCAVACYSIAVGGGFASYLLGLNRKTYEMSGVDTVGNSANAVKEPGFGWMTGFLFVVCFVGLFVLIPLRKVMIVDLKLTYPSGLATAVLINGFHSQGDKAAKKQVHGFLKYFSASFLWGFFQWFFSGKEGCGFKQFPTFGLQAWKQTFFFDFSLTYVLRETIPMWIGIVGYVLLSIMSIIVIPIMFPQLKWYYVLVAYMLAPSLAFCNAYGAGLTDINMAYNYGKVALFILAALTGKENGVVAGLAGCGLIKSVVSVACILMQDFKTAHYTLTSPRAMFLSQAIGTAIGCITAPLSFFVFYKAFDVGNPYGEFKAPYALIYRNMAILGVQGFSALPHHCLQLCYGFFALAVAVNLVRDFSPHKIGKWMPLPMVMAVPFLVGAYFAVDMCLGTLIVFVWQKLKAKEAELMVPAVASGLICGEGLWILPASILALAKINPPICMKFLPS